MHVMFLCVCVCVCVCLCVCVGGGGGSKGLRIGCSSDVDCGKTAKIPCEHRK